MVEGEGEGEEVVRDEDVEEGVDRSGVGGVPVPGTLSSHTLASASSRTRQTSWIL